MAKIRKQDTGNEKMYHADTSVEQEKHHTDEADQMIEQLNSSVCSVCMNSRPKYEWNRDFTYAELHAATNGFSPKNFLSEGGFGSVYKGEMYGQKIAVKQHMYASLNGDKEFKSEVDALCKARHQNVVMLLGSCSEGNHRLLVYEYVCNGSLDQHLSKHSRRPLSWQDRVKVANGAAKGLLHLHDNNIIHRDMTPNNILLTHDYEVLLGDFGLARFVTEDSSYSTECVGNLAYCAPEYTEYGKVSIKTDVYSFGMVLLNLITGMRTTDKRLGEKGLVEWAIPLLRQGKCQAFIDGRMMNSHDSYELYWMCRLAGNCLKRDPQKRLNMSTVVKALTHIVEGCSCNNVQNDHTLVMSSCSKSKGFRSSSADLFASTGLSSHWSTEASAFSFFKGSQNDIQKDQHEKFSINIEQETAGNQSLFYISEKEEHRSSKEVSHMEEEFTNSPCSVCNNRRPKFGWGRDFSYAELYTATQGFTDKNVLSEGGLGPMYKGQMNGTMISVKQQQNVSFQGEKEFKSEVDVLRKARHENVVMLLASCSERNNRLLVYEYVCNGSLDQHLSEHSRSPLSWENRMKVAIGAAKGLLYLHENNIIHRDIRPNNILITHDHQALLGDFRFARTQENGSIHEIVGRLGYLAPEYAEYGVVSTKTDVYSFGVVLLQLITGMRTTDKRLGGETLVGWARPLLRERNYPYLIDERIINFNDFHQLFWMVRMAEKCLSRDPQKRLNMVAVVNALSIIVEGSICNITIRDYPPAMSDLFLRPSDCGESEDDMQGSSESEDAQTVD